MLGFTYNGIHSSQFGLYYTPNGDDRWFHDPEYDVYSDDVDWRNGGYYYDSKAKNRTFTINCYFEEIDIATRQKIKQWVKMGTSGKLIFDDMPFVYWYVHPGKIPVGKWYLDTNESHSGTVTITFMAYSPFGYLTRKANTGSEDDGAEDYCGLIPESEMPDAPTTSDTEFVVYNPGTEECGLSVEISGTASNPIRFFNNSNNTECVLNALPSGNLILNIDGETGYVSVGGANGYSYHDMGVVRLEPNRTYNQTGYTYLGKNGTYYMFSFAGVQADDKLIGATVTLDGVSDTTFTVATVNTEHNRVHCTRTGAGDPDASGTCRIMESNKISIQEKTQTGWAAPTTLTMTRIAIDYKPRIL